jgi:hypothetical protein
MRRGKARIARRLHSTACGMSAAVRGRQGEFTIGRFSAAGDVMSDGSA